MNDATPPSGPLLAAAEIITVGLPFCAFKVLTGMALLDVGAVGRAGFVLVVLGAVDLGFNLVNLGGLVVGRRRVAAVCLLAHVQRRFSRSTPPSDLGIALDVFLSFALVALVVGGGMIPHIPPALLPVWNVAVVLNVLGAGTSRLYASLQTRARS